MKFIVNRGGYKAENVVTTQANEDNGEYAHPYSGDLTLDGVRVAEFSDDGKGSEMDIDFLVEGAKTDLLNFTKTNLEEDFQDYPERIAMFIGRICFEDAIVDLIVKDIDKKTYLMTYSEELENVKEEDDGEIRTFDHSYNDKVKAHLEKIMPENNYIILNEIFSDLIESKILQSTKSTPSNPQK